MSDLKCANCRKYLFEQPMQCPCGDRLCGKCFQEYQSSGVPVFICPLCESEVLLEQCFRDRAVTMDLKKATIPCTSHGCPWEGRSEDYKDHANICKFAIIPCLHLTYGCQEQLPRSEMSVHVSKCGYRPMECQWCKKHIRNEAKHLKNDCPLVPEYCNNGCGEQVPRKELEKHMNTLCTHQLRSCDYKEDGCQFLGYMKELTKHYKDQSGYHTQLMKKAFRKVEQAMDDRIRTLTLQNSDLKSEVDQFKKEISLQLQSVADAVVKAESAIQHLQEGFAEMALSLSVETLRATSYDGVYTWKIPEIRRRRHEARTGQAVSLCSPPFYTSRDGYKLCLRLYLNGDGPARGSHLAFYITLMRGEFDSICKWPFKKTVTLALLDQNRNCHVIQSFQPDPRSSSFIRPHNEMNVASGCPMFASLSVLSDSSYVKDDTMFLKCWIQQQMQ